MKQSVSIGYTNKEHINNQLFKSDFSLFEAIISYCYV